LENLCELYGNGTYDICNAAQESIIAYYNYWGTEDTAIINSRIHDFFDDNYLGIVHYLPYAHSTPQLIYPAEECCTTDTALNFFWHRSTVAFGYEFQVDTTNSFSAPLLVDSMADTSRSVDLSEDIYYWRVRAYDDLGGQSEFSTIRRLYVDRTPPEIDSTTQWSNTNFSGPFEIRAKAADGISGIDSVILYYRRDEDPEWVAMVMKISGEWYIDSIPEASWGDDSIRYYLAAFDRAGNKVFDPMSKAQGYYGFVANAPLSVTLSFFAAQSYDDHVEIKWRTESEHNTDGWVIERSTCENGCYSEIGELDAMHNGNQVSDYIWCDGKIDFGVTYYYRLLEKEQGGMVNCYGPVKVTTKVLVSKLLGNKPNPFFGSTDICYQVGGPGGDVGLRIYNILGQAVYDWQEIDKKPGRYVARWDASDNYGHKVSAGVYVYQISIGKKRFTSRMMLLK
jgi:hypothetical protein